LKTTAGLVQQVFGKKADSVLKSACRQADLSFPVKADFEGSPKIEPSTYFLSRESDVLTEYVNKTKNPQYISA